jgi:hypothetical protein
MNHETIWIKPMHTMTTAKTPAPSAADSFHVDWDPHEAAAAYHRALPVSAGEVGPGVEGLRAGLGGLLFEGRRSGRVAATSCTRGERGPASLPLTVIGDRQWGQLTVLPTR